MGRVDKVPSRPPCLHPLTPLPLRIHEVRWLEGAFFTCHQLNIAFFAAVVCARHETLLSPNDDCEGSQLILTVISFFRVALAIILLYYSFGIIGMECFSGLKLKDCCKYVKINWNIDQTLWEWNCEASIQWLKVLSVKAPKASNCCRFESGTST